MWKNSAVSASTKNDAHKRKLVPFLSLVMYILKINILSWSLNDYIIVMQSENLSLLQLTNTHTHTHPFIGPLSGTTHVSRYQKGKTNLDFTGARDSEWQWHQLGHMQVCTSLQTDNHDSTSLLSFLQAGCPSCRPTNSIKALKEDNSETELKYCSL